MGSATLGAAEFDAELIKTPWFNAKQPAASQLCVHGLQAEWARASSRSSGKLTIKGVARDVVVPVQIYTSRVLTPRLQASSTMKRLDFKIGEGEWADTSVVANDVNVKFKLAFTGL